MPRRGSLHSRREYKGAFDVKKRIEGTSRKIAYQYQATRTLGKIPSHSRFSTFPLVHSDLRTTAVAITKKKRKGTKRQRTR